MCRACGLQHNLPARSHRLCSYILKNPPSTASPQKMKLIFKQVTTKTETAGATSVCQEELAVTAQPWREDLLVGVAPWRQRGEADRGNKAREVAMDDNFRREEIPNHAPSSFEGIIHLRIENRNSKKRLCTIEGILGLTEEPQDLLKRLKTSLGCNGCIRKDGATGHVLQLQVIWAWVL